MEAAEEDSLTVGPEAVVVSTEINHSNREGNFNRGVSLTGEVVISEEGSVAKFGKTLVVRETFKAGDVDLVDVDDL